MRLRANPLGRLPRPTAFSALELLLLALIAVQAARLFWILVTPVGPLGDWKAPSTLNALAAASAGLGDFDPFFRLSGAGGPAVVTGLNLKLYGVREDRATGRGSAIIALPDGTQQSFAIGDEIIPGVRLAEVGFDNVTIDRNGAREQIFLDQSTPAANGAPAAVPEVATPTTSAPQPIRPAPPPPAAAPPPPPPVQAGQAFQFQPRVANGRVDGVIVNPGVDGGRAFRAAGFESGDVIVSVNGQRVSSMEQARAAMGRSGQAAVIVDRGGRAVPLRVRFNP
jgi:general secretion pathway protein C